MRFFEVEGVSKKTLSLIFVVKILFGLLLWSVYTFYYTDRSTADIYKYFDDSKIMFNSLFTKPLDYFQMLFGIKNDTPYFDQYYSQMNHWHTMFESNLYSDSHTIIRLNAVLRLFSFGFYNVHTVFMCFISLIGLTAIYKTFVSFLKNKKKELVCAIFLIPSVLFWGSGVLKEGILFFALGLLVYHFNRSIQSRFNFKSVFIIIFSAILIFYTKFYILVSLIPGMIAFFLIAKTNNMAPFIKYLLVTVTIVILGLNMEKIFPGYDPLEILSIKQRDCIVLVNGGVVLYNDSFIIKIENDKRNEIVHLNNDKCTLKKGSKYLCWHINNMNDTLQVTNSTDTSIYTLLWDVQEAASKIKIGKLEPTFLSLLRNSPQAFFNAMFRPFLFESKSILIFISAFENTVILLFIVFTLFFIKPLDAEEWNVFLFCFSFVFILYIIIGLTTPVLGAIVRYKTPAIPFVLISMLLLIDKEKIVQRFPKLSKFLN